MKTPNHRVPAIALALAVLSLESFALQPVQAGIWVSNSPMNAARYGHTATLLPDGRVLVAGGGGINANSSSSAELFDPATGAFTATGSMAVTRGYHTATLLPNGEVLVAGGLLAVSSAEIYNPATGRWRLTGTMATGRYHHTATLLPNGKVLVTGGVNLNAGGHLSSAELYDPVMETWTDASSMTVPRSQHTATLLTNGMVLVAGGVGLSSAELYNPATGAWTPTGSMTSARRLHTATLLPSGKVLVAGGINSGGSAISSAETYDPATGTWTPVGAMATERFNHTATLLPNGNVLTTGGGVNPVGTAFTVNAELYQPATGTWVAGGMMNAARDEHTATLLADGSVLVTGGRNRIGNSVEAVSNTEIYDPTLNPATGTDVVTGPLNSTRSDHSAILLPNGKVLVAGGSYTGIYSTRGAEVYDPANGKWTNTGNMNVARDGQTMTLLSDGTILATGGYGSSWLSSAEIYDVFSGQWSLVGSMRSARNGHTATLLPNGKVLVAGGYNGSARLSSAELYDPVSKTWMNTGSLNIARNLHTAVLLPNGKVLVAGGADSPGSATSSAELYDPAIGKWTLTGSLRVGRCEHTMTLLENGKVLVAGGEAITSGPFSSAELYDPDTGTWTLTSSMNYARTLHTANLLPGGKVLVAGGAAFRSLIPVVESYEPRTGIWSLAGALATPRYYNPATTLPNGQVLFAGGAIITNNSVVPISNAELFSAGLGYSNAWQPQITTVTSPLNPGSSLVVKGARFRGIAEGSSGNTQDSATDYPLVQLRSMESGQTTFLLTKNWSASVATTTAEWKFPPGWAMVTVFVNGIQSTSAIVNVSGPVPTTTTLTNVTEDYLFPGQSLSATYLVSPVPPGGGTPTGTMTLTNELSAVTGPAPTGTVSMLLTNVGTFHFAATYSGDSNFLPSSSLPVLSRTVLSMTNPAAWSASVVVSNGTRFLQTSLMNQLLTLTNVTSQTLAAVRVTVHLSAADLAAHIIVYNASGTNSAGEPYLQYNYPAPPGDSVTFTTEFYSPDRVTVPHPTFTVELVAPETLTAPPGTIEAVARPPVVLAPDNALLIDFLTVKGATYYILYKDNLANTNWNVAQPPVAGTGYDVQWVDDGPPKTQSPPSTAPNRFYEVLKAN